jgi:hypothetical protein
MSARTVNRYRFPTALQLFFKGAGWTAAGFQHFITVFFIVVGI